MVNRGYRSWVEINLSNLERNYEIYRSHAHLNPDGAVMAVVKADAYGHGDQEVTRVLSEIGVRHFAVSNIDEAIRVRQAAPEGQILVLGYTPFFFFFFLVRYDITYSLLSEEYAAGMAAEGLPVRCQFAIDTGMRRIGLNADAPEACERAIRRFAGQLRLDGLFTHLCAAGSPEENEFTARQIRLFEDVCARVADLSLPYRHCLNSAGGLWHASAASDMVRLGIVLFGLKPEYENSLPAGIRPVLSWKSVVSMVKTVLPGDTVGYGRSFVVSKPMRIATVPTGYADGYARMLAGKGWVLINGSRAPVIGSVCMDQMMVDVTAVDGIGIDTEVVLIGQSGDEILTADELAHLYGTIGYEVVCGISKRVCRYYVRD